MCGVSGIFSGEDVFFFSFISISCMLVFLSSLFLFVLSPRCRPSLSSLLSLCPRSVEPKKKKIFLTHQSVITHSLVSAFRSRQEPTPRCLHKFKSLANQVGQSGSFIHSFIHSSNYNQSPPSLKLLFTLFPTAPSRPSLSFFLSLSLTLSFLLTLLLSPPLAPPRLPQQPLPLQQLTIRSCLRVARIRVRDTNIHTLSTYRSAIYLPWSCPGPSFSSQLKERDCRTRNTDQ